MNFTELSIFVSALAASIVSIIYATQKSRCTNIKLCGVVECERDVVHEHDLENQLSAVENTQPTTINQK